jgi:hypothetical protein
MRSRRRTRSESQRRRKAKREGIPIIPGGGMVGFLLLKQVRSIAHDRSLRLDHRSLSICTSFEQQQEQMGTNLGKLRVQNCT